MTPPAPRFEDHVGLVHSQAKYGLQWAGKAGWNTSYDDMFQIASMAFVLAAKGYDPGTGNKFSTYYTQVVFSEFRREIGLMTGVKNLNGDQRAAIQARREENARRRECATPELPEMSYGVQTVAFGDLRIGDDGSSFEESVASDVRSPEEIVEFAQVWRQSTKELSPLACLIVEWLYSPPPQLMRELQAHEAHAALANSQGKRPRNLLRDGVSLQAVKRFVKLATDATDGELLMAEVELEKVVERIEEIYAS